MFDINKIDEAINRLADSICDSKESNFDDISVNVQKITALAELLKARAVYSSSFVQEKVYNT